MSGSNRFTGPLILSIVGGLLTLAGAIVIAVKPDADTIKCQQTGGVEVRARTGYVCLDSSKLLKL